MKLKTLLPLVLATQFNAQAKLAAWYPLDGPTSTTASENVAGNSAAFIGSNFIEQTHPSSSDTLGTSYLFTKGGALNLGADAAVQPTDQFTISFFFQPATLDAFDRILESQSGNANTQDGIRIDTGGQGNQVRVLIRSNSAANTLVTHPTILKNDGTWYFCAIRYDSTLGDGSALKSTVVELDGTPVDEAAIANNTSTAAALNTGAITAPHALETILGSDNLTGTGNNTLNGALDEFAFFDNSDGQGVLTDAQLADGANFGPSGTELINSFMSNQETASPSDPATLSWNINEPFDSLILTDDFGNETDLAPLTTGGSGTTNISPSQSTIYYLRGISGDVINVHVLQITSSTPPQITSFTSSSPLAPVGGEIDLTFETIGSDNLTLDPGNIDLTGQTGTSLTLSETTTFTLTATNSFGSTSQDLTVSTTNLPIPNHSYLAFNPSNTEATWTDFIGSRDMNIFALALESPVTSANTNITAAYRTDGDPSGSTATAFQFPEASFEIWFRPSEITADHQVIFETGGGRNGFSILLNEDGLRFLGSADDIRSLDQVIPLDTLNFNDFVQVVFSQNTVTDTFSATVRDTSGAVITNTTSADIFFGGNGATAFNWGTGVIGVSDNNLGGRTEAADVSPAGLSPFSGEIAIINVYNSILDETEIEDLFNSIASTSLGQLNAITNISYNGSNQVTLTWNSQEGVNYDLQFSSNLENWTPSGQAMVAESSETTRTFSVFPNQTKSFFRIAEVLP